MILLAVALQAIAAGPTTPKPASVTAYQACLEQIVTANESVAKADYQPLDVVLDRIKVTCSNQRAQAREALSKIVWGNHPEQQNFFWDPSEAEKENLIAEATIRWANNVVSWLATKDVK